MHLHARCRSWRPGPGKTRRRNKCIGRPATSSAPQTRRPAGFRTTLAMPAMPESEALASTDRRGSRHSKTVHQTSVDKTYAVGKLAFACRLQALPLGPSSTQGLRWGGCQGLRAGDKGGDRGWLSPRLRQRSSEREVHSSLKPRSPPPRERSRAGPPPARGARARTARGRSPGGR